MQLRDEGALKLAEVIQASVKLRKLDVTSNSVTSRGLCALATATANHQPRTNYSWNATSEVASLDGERTNQIRPSLSDGAAHWQQRG